jgi:hypothetical protein
MQRITTVGLLVVLLLFVLFSLKLSQTAAEEYTSPNFILQDPVITVEGGRSTSTSFELFSSAGQPAPGESTAATFIQRGGFLYFPIATSPTLSASAGDAQVSLSWTASVGTLANITNYDVGTATVSGGPYTFENVGGVLAFTKTGLTNGTTYYFIVRANAGTLALAKSSEASATPSGAAAAPSGGGGAIVGSVVFSGRSYPASRITLLRDGFVVGTIAADAEGNFSITSTRLSATRYNFVLYAEDQEGRRSSLISFPVTITQSTPTTIGNIVIPPTISADKAEVRAGDSITFTGSSVIGAEVILSVMNERGEVRMKTAAAQDGSYVFELLTATLERGAYVARTKSALPDGLVSALSTIVEFLVGEENREARRLPPSCPPRADFTGDCRVNLIDFSILVYWFGRPNPPLEIDLNGDGVIDLVDFSVLVYYWTG